MIYREWSEYQKALVSFLHHKSKHEEACEMWKKTASDFDGHSKLTDRLFLICCLLIITAFIISIACGSIRTEWGWPLLWLLLTGLHHWLDEKCRGYNKQHFLESNLRPLLLATEPGFDPLDEQADELFDESQTPSEACPSPSQRIFCILIVELIFKISRHSSLVILFLLPVCFAVSGLSTAKRKAPPVTEAITIKSLEWPAHMPSPFQVPVQPLPENGLTFQNVPAPALAEIEIKSAPGLHYVVRFDDAITGELSIMTVVHAGKTLRLTLPYGNYFMKYACGVDWYGHQYLFGPATRYGQLVQLMTFTEGQKKAPKVLLDYKHEMKLKSAQ